MRSGVLKALPYPMQVLVGLLAWRANSQTLHGQGTARYSLDEIALLRTEVWDAIDALVADAKSAASPKSAQPGGSGMSSDVSSSFSTAFVEVSLKATDLSV